MTFDLRIIASTSQDLKDKLADGQFREDLYRCFAEVSIWVPPLRQHREDIPALVDYYARIIVDSERLPFRRFSTAAVNLIRNRDWPGNVRELQNYVERAIVLADGNTLASELFPPHVRGQAPIRIGRAMNNDRYRTRFTTRLG